jgi:toxin-antitoxin system PIN domain toxin
MSWSRVIVTTTERTYLLDVNVLIALTNRAHVHHKAAHAWLDDVKTRAAWATTPVTECAFVRLMLNPAVSGQAVRPSTVLEVLRALRARPEHQFVADDSSLAEALVSMTTLVGRNQVTDFHLVNLAACNGAVLASFDSRIVEALRPADRRHIELIPTA